MYNSNKFEMAVIYGRRRVGKTTLINEFCKNKVTVLFPAIESNAEQNLEILSGLFRISKTANRMQSFDIKALLMRFPDLKSYQRTKELYLLLMNTRILQKPIKVSRLFCRNI